MKIANARKAVRTEVETADGKEDMKTAKAELERQKTLRYCLRNIRLCWKVGLDAAKLQGPDEFKACKTRYEDFRNDFLVDHPEAESIINIKI